MRVLVCGGRTYGDYSFLMTILSAYHVEYGIDVLIHGKANGADRLAQTWAERHLIPTLQFPADWGAKGKKAGPLRNAEMLRDGKPDIVIAFPGGVGTADMVRQARKAGVKVVETGAAS